MSARWGSRAKHGHIREWKAAKEDARLKGLAREAWVETMYLASRPKKWWHKLMWWKR